MNPAKAIQEASEHIEAAASEIQEIKQKASAIVTREDEVSEEIDQAQKIIKSREPVERGFGPEAKGGTEEAREDLKQALQNLERVEMGLKDVYSELESEINDELDAVGQLRNLLVGIKSGKYVIPAQDAETVASEASKAEDQIELSQKQIDEILSEAREAKKLSERVNSIAENVFSSASNLRERSDEISEGLEEVISGLEHMNTQMNSEVESEERRKFLKTAASAGAVMSLSGCMGFDFDPPMPEGSSSVESKESSKEETITYNVEARADSNHDLQSLVSTAVAYWERNSVRYAGRNVEFEASSTPDTIIYFMDEVSKCGRAPEGTDIVGCTRSRGSEVRIETGHSNEVTLRTIKHEFGHVLGLTHSDDPQSIMSGDPADRIENYSQRQEALNLANKGVEMFNEAGKRYKESAELYKSEDFRKSGSVMEEAENRYSNSVKHFNKAKNVCDSLNAAEAQASIEEWVELVNHMKNASKSFVEHIEAYLHQDRELMEQKYKQYRKQHDKAEDVDPTSISKIQRQLKL